MRKNASAALGVSLALAAAAGIAQPAEAQAPKFPERPVTAVVGFPAGGGTDLIVRGMQRAYERALGQTLVVRNVPGVLLSQQLIQPPFR